MTNQKINILSMTNQKAEIYLKGVHSSMTIMTID